MSDTPPLPSPEPPPPPGSGGAATPEVLPPVEPPSAGYIVQLFLIPALIVAAVIGVWALFGRLADSETDWQQLVTELRSSNEHRRWRAAMGLAQVLRNQQLAPGEDETILAKQPEVAAALCQMLGESLDSTSPSDDDVKHQEFLARTLGALESDDTVLPLLGRAMSSDRQEDVRKSALMSVAMVAGRHFEDAAGHPSNDSSAAENVKPLNAPLNNPTIADTQVLQQLKLAAQDQSPGIRHLAGYALGLVSGPDSIRQLRVLLLDSDPLAQANAAVGLARNGDTESIPTLLRLVSDRSTQPSRESFQSLTPDEQQQQLKERQFEDPMVLSNCLRAIDSLYDRLPPEQQSETQAVVTQLLEAEIPSNIRLQAAEIQARVRQ